MAETARPTAQQEEAATLANALHQITLGFNPHEDRLLLRITTTGGRDCRMWLTRRFVKVLWGALQQALDTHPDIKAQLAPEARKAVLAWEHHEAVQRSDISEGREEARPAAAAEGVAGEGVPTPELVVGGAVTPGRGRMTRMRFQTLAGKDVTFTLTKQLLHALCHLLITTTLKAGWDLGLMVGDGNVVVPPGQRMLH